MWCRPARGKLLTVMQRVSAWVPWIGRTGVASVLVLVSVFVLAACGGDTRRASEPSIGHGGTTALAASASLEPVVVAAVSSPVTNGARRAYIARLDAVCSRLDPERNRQRENASGDLAQVAGRYQDAIALGAGELREVESVTPPRGDARALRVNVFDVITRELAVRKLIHTALLAGNMTALETQQQRLDQLTGWLAGFARGYGFKICGTD